MHHRLARSPPGSGCGTAINSPAACGATAFPRSSSWLDGLGSCTGCSKRKRATAPDRKSTRLNSSHTVISYAVFCLKKKKKKQNEIVVSDINVTKEGMDWTQLVHTRVDQQQLQRHDDSTEVLEAIQLARGVIHTTHI